MLPACIAQFCGFFVSDSTSDAIANAGMPSKPSKSVRSNVWNIPDNMMISSLFLLDYLAGAWLRRTARQQNCVNDRA
jgi:hypothetical protein